MNVPFLRVLVVVTHAVLAACDGCWTVWGCRGEWKGRSVRCGQGHKTKGTQGHCLDSGGRGSGGSFAPKCVLLARLNMLKQNQNNAHNTHTQTWSRKAPHQFVAVCRCLLAFCDFPPSSTASPLPRSTSSLLLPVAPAHSWCTCVRLNEPSLPQQLGCCRAQHASTPQHHQALLSFWPWQAVRD